MQSIHETIRAELLSWPGVTAASHRFGGTEYRFGAKEMGHVHGDRLADLPFPRAIRDELVSSGQAEPHHILPDTGWVSRWMNGPDDAQAVIRLFRLNYERYSSARAKASL